MPGKLLKEVLSLLPSSVNAVEFARAWALSELELPACARETVVGGCKGVVMNGGLYTQCLSKVCNKNGFCKRCINSFVEEGMPKLGLWAERMGENWQTTDGRRPITYMQYLKKKNMSRKDGEEFLRSKDVVLEIIPDSEWELPKRGRGRGRAVSDTSSEGERTTIRFLPLEGKKKSPKKDESHSGKNGAKLRVCVYQESKVVTKVNPSNWTDEAHAKFAELYCEGRQGEDEGKEFGRSTKRSKKAAAADQLAAMHAKMEEDMKAKQAEMEAQMEAMKKEYEAQLAAARESKKDDTNSDETKDDEAAAQAEKKRKEAAVKKARAEKKAKAEAEKKRKAAELKAKAEAEKKRKAEELKAQLAALEAHTAENEMELGEFDDSDDEEAQEFNPFEHNGVTYHRDDEDKLYTEDGDFWGYINESNEVVEGEPDEE